MAEATVHPSAIIEAGAQLGAGVQIWHWVHVRAGAVIGEGSSVGQGCYVGAVTVGRGCRIQNHVSLYDGVTLEDDVFLGPSCVFTNVKHPRAHVQRKDQFARTLVCKGASIGANATIMCGVTIGEYALIGVMSRTMQVSEYYVAGRKVPA
ncbi:MAG: N-acetyltransferase, partial [Myxococcales bacterium]|nr:N-acetyltransferase [Myxococcales bacterium]